MIADMNIPIPPIKEQHAIAEALSDVDSLIASIDALIAKKRVIKQGVMQELLTGKSRLPGFDNQWETRKLVEISSLIKGTQIPKDAISENGRFAHLNGGISPSGFTDKFNTLGDMICISEGGNSCGYVQLFKEPFWSGGHCYTIKPKGINNHFLYHLLKNKQALIMSLRVGSGLPNIQKKSLLNLELFYPFSQKEQTSIAQVLDDMDSEIIILEKKLAKTKTIKQGMMQELLTGRIRLKGG
jgi:type I restriction enzyme S subunit